MQSQFFMLSKCSPMVICSSRHWMAYMGNLDRNIQSSVLSKQSNAAAINHQRLAVSKRPVLFAILSVSGSHLS